MRQPNIATTALAPPALRAGDTVAICSPASPVHPERLRRGAAVLSERFRVRVTEGALAEHGYLAGDDDLRAEELNQLLRDPDVRAIIPAEGGYGITRILDRLDAAALRADPKLVVGFSEGTALLCWALAVAGVRGIHGPMAASLGERPVQQQQHLLDLLEGKPLGGPIPCADVGGGGATATSPSSGRHEGPLLGGNMTVISATIGTAYQIGFANALLFIEDIGSLPSTLDRLLAHLRAAGVLAGVKAALQARMEDLLKRTLAQIGLDNSTFNVEFFWDEAADRIWLLEINTRISQSHSDLLFHNVDGASNHLAMIETALGRRPRMPYRQGPFARSAKWYYRRLEDAYVEAVPELADIAAVQARFPEARVQINVRPGMRLSELVEQDSYSYDLAWIFLGGADTPELESRYREASALLPFRFSDEPFSH